MGGAGITFFYNSLVTKLKIWTCDEKKNKDHQVNISRSRIDVKVSMIGMAQAKSREMTVF